MDAAPLSPAQRRKAYLVCLLGWMFDFYDLILFAYLAKAIGAEWGWGERFHHNKALLVGLALGVSGIGGIVFGGLADRYGRKKVMVWTILIYSLSTGLCGFAGGLASLAVLRCLTGLGVGGEWASGHALMAEIYPKEERGRASALLQAGEPLGVGLAVLAGLWLEPRVGWRMVFFISALPALVVLLIRSQVPESPLWLQRHGRGAPGFVQQYRVLLRDHWKRALQGWVLGASKLGTYWVVYVWLPEYFAELHARAGGAGLGAEAFSTLRLKFILLAQGGQFLGMLAFGQISDHFGRRPAFSAYSLLTMFGILALARFGPDMLLRPAWFWAAMLAVGFGSGCTAGFGALLAELFPTSVRNTAMGSVYNLARGFQFVTQLVMGYLAASSGVANGLLLAAALAFITATWIWTFPETRGIQLEEG